MFPPSGSTAKAGTLRKYVKRTGMGNSCRPNEVRKKEKCAQLPHYIIAERRQKQSLTFFYILAVNESTWRASTFQPHHHLRGTDFLSIECWMNLPVPGIKETTRCTSVSNYGHPACLLRTCAFEA